MFFVLLASIRVLKSVAGASEGFNVIIHVVIIVVDLIHPVRLASVRVDHKLVPVVHILHVLVISLVEPFPLLSDGIGKTTAFIPNLQSTARHHQKRLKINELATRNEQGDSRSGI